MQTALYLCRKSIWAFITIYLMLVTTVCFAENVIGLKQALENTLDKNIELKKYPFQIREEEAMSRQAGIFPAPQINLDVEDFYGTQNYNDFGQSEITLTFSKTIEMGGKRQLRLAESKAIQDRIKLEYELAKIDILAETSRRYYEILRIQSIQNLIGNKIENEKLALEKIKKLKASGVSDPVDIASMSLRLKHSQSRLLKLNDEHQIAKSRMTVMWQSEPEFDTAAGNILTTPSLPSLEKILSNIDQMPSVLHKTALMRESDQRAQLARADGKNDITYGIGLRHKQDDNAQTLNMGVSIPLTFENPNRGRIEAAQTALEASRYESDAAKIYLKQTLTEHWRRMYQYARQVEQLNIEIIPEANHLVSVSLKSYRRGTTDILQVINAQDEWLEAQLNLIELNTLILGELLELERLTGQSITTEQGQ